MRSLFALIPLFFACTAEKGSDDGSDTSNTGTQEEEVDLPADGIWLMQVHFNSDDSCTENLDHNFEDSYTAEEGPWTETEIIDYSDALGFIQISQLNEESAVLVIGTEVWPGVASGDGWVFEWLATDTVKDGREHDEGYVYQEQIDRSDLSSLALTIDGDEAHGTWTFAFSEDVLWTESDTWDSKVGMDSGDIPSADYLYYDEGDLEGFSRVNTAAESECSGTQCRLEVLNTCEGTATLDLIRTGYDEEAAYDQLEAVAHPFGTGS